MIDKIEAGKVYLNYETDKCKVLYVGKEYVLYTVDDVEWTIMKDETISQWSELSKPTVDLYQYAWKDREDVWAISTGFYTDAPHFTANYIPRAKACHRLDYTKITVLSNG